MFDLNTVMSVFLIFNHMCNSFILKDNFKFIINLKLMNALVNFQHFITEKPLVFS